MTNVISMSEWKARQVIRQSWTAAAVNRDISSCTSRVGSSAGHLSILPVKSTSRKRCHCCDKRATHCVSNNGVGLALGCLARCEAYIKQAIQRAIWKDEMRKQRDSEI